MFGSNNMHWAVKGFFILICVSAAVIGISALVMYLWNAILPSVVRVNTITFWQAAGLLVLCRLLFGGFKGRGGHRGGWGRKHELKQKFMNMSEEEKAAFKQKWRERCGRY